MTDYDERVRQAQTLLILFRLWLDAVVAGLLDRAQDKGVIRFGVTL